LETIWEIKGYRRIAKAERILSFPARNL